MKCIEDKALAAALASNSRNQAGCRQVCHVILLCANTERKGQDNHTITCKGETKKKKSQDHLIVISSKAICQRAQECKPLASGMTASSAVALYQGCRGHSCSMLPTLGPDPPQLLPRPPGRAKEASTRSTRQPSPPRYELLGRELQWRDQEAEVTSAFWSRASLLLCGWGRRGGHGPSVTPRPSPAGASGTGNLLLFPPHLPAQLCGGLARNQAPPAWSSWQNVHLLPHASQPGQGPAWRKGNKLLGSGTTLASTTWPSRKKYHQTLQLKHP